MPIKRNFFTNSRPFNPYNRMQFQRSMAEPEPDRQQIFDYEQPALDRYEKHVRNIPNQEDYSPSIWRRILAGVAGGTTGWSSGNPTAALEAAENVNTQPYRRSLDNWSLQEQGLKAGADIEGQRSNQRLKYLEAQLEQNRDERDYEIESDKVNIQAHQAETRRKSTELAAARDSAVDAREKARIENQRQNWIKQRENEASRIRMESSARAASNASYRDRTSKMGERPAESPIQQANRRKIAEEAVMNMNPDWLNKDTGYIDDKFRVEFEAEVQKRLNPRKNINLLPEFEDEEDEWELER